jgi:hypothetical protein
MIKKLLAAVSGVELVFAYLIRKFMLKRKLSDPAQNLQRYTAAVIVSLAISESIGIYGLVLYLLGEELSTLYTFIGISAMAMIFYRPKENEV